MHDARKLIGIALFALCLNWAYASNSAEPLATAPTYQSLDELKHKAELFLRQQLNDVSTGRVEVKIEGIDSRLQLAACPDDKINFYLPPNTEALRATTIGVRCDHTNAWSLFIPVKVSLMADVLVTTKPLARGMLVQTKDVKLANMNISRLTPGYMQLAEEAIGKVTLQPLMTGAPVLRSQLKIPDVIRQGAAVTINANAGNIKVSMHGIAMNPGKYGDVISVKNTSSSRIIQARVAGPQIVEALFESTATPLRQKYP